MFTAIFLSDDWYCSLHPVRLKLEFSSFFVPHLGSFSRSTSSWCLCSRTWTLCTSWHRLVCPVAGPSSFFAVCWQRDQREREVVNKQMSTPKGKQKWPQASVFPTVVYKMRHMQSHADVLLLPLLFWYPQVVAMHWMFHKDQWKAEKKQL